jgi:ribosomal protein S18 acetylase RimI-like enzyme
MDRAMGLAEEDGAVFLHSRSSSTDPRSAAMLQEFGFRQVSTLLGIRRSTEIDEASPGIFSIRWAAGEDYSDLSALSGETFRQGTRISNDPKLGPEWANSFYRAWAGNTSGPSRVATMGDAVVGFVLYHRESESTARLDLLAVSAQARGRGVAEALIRTALGDMAKRECPWIVGGVEIASQAAMNLYWRLGFKAEGAWQQFHRHEG